MKETNEMKFDNLFAAGQLMPVVGDSMTIAQSAEIVKRGTIVNASGAKVAAADADVYAVVAEDVDTTAGAKVAPVYLTGEFNEDALVAGVSIENIKGACRKVGIFVKKNIKF